MPPAERPEGAGTVAGLLDGLAVEHGGRVALVEGDRALTFAELRGAAGLLAGELSAWGVGRGDVGREQLALPCRALLGHLAGIATRALESLETQVDERRADRPDLVGGGAESGPLGGGAATGELAGPGRFAARRLTTVAWILSSTG